MRLELLLDFAISRRWLLLCCVEKAWICCSDARKSRVAAAF